MYPNICFAGKMGSGKTTLSNYLIKKYGYTRLSFAESLKNIVNVLNITHSPFITLLYVIFKYPLPIKYYTSFYEILRTTLKLPSDSKNRMKLQYAGHKVRELIDENFWVNIVLKKMLSNKHLHYVIDDVRYPNELDLLKQYGFLDIKIECPDDIRLERLRKLYGIESLSDERLHADSEKYIDSMICSYKLTNVGYPYHQLINIIYNFIMERYEKN